MSKLTIVSNCDKCNKEDSINTLTGLCPSCEIELYKNDDKIIIPIYYYVDEMGKKVIDEDSIREEFENKLSEVLGEWKAYILLEVTTKKSVYLLN